MGSFRDIVRSRRGRAGRIAKFALGLNIVPEKTSRMLPYFIKVTFSEKGSQPIISSVHYQFDSESYLTIERADYPNKVNFVTPNSEALFDFRLDDHWPLYLSYYVADRARMFSDSPPAEQRVIKYISDILFPIGGILHDYEEDNEMPKFNIASQNFPRLIPVAPLRSKPKRTYDPVRETESPEGAHIPMLMMRLDRTDKRGWNTLHDDLTDFGNVSGLFSDILVKRHGKQMSDPFQLQVKVRSGSRANIMDVGYGVSQSLPILVDVRSNRNCTFLMQQPEVHLHPRSQAELAGLFVESFKKKDNRFLIETHSDYIVDRVRILVKNGMIKSEDVSILYFAPKGNAASIHSISLEDEGNLQNVPRGYRDFFVKESDKLLGFAD